MDKRGFLAAASAAAMLPATMPARASGPPTGPTLLTVGGAITRSNRGAVDPALDQMLVKHGVQFVRALAFDTARLQRMAKVTIRPTLEYDSRRHTLAGPLLTTVLDAAGVKLQAATRLGLRAVDGYNALVTLGEARSYRMIIATHMDGKPLALGGLGPQWAVYEADAIPAFRDKPVTERFALCPWGLYYIDVMADRA